MICLFQVVGVVTYVLKSSMEVRSRQVCSNDNAKDFSLMSNWFTAFASFRTDIVHSSVLSFGNEIQKQGMFKISHASLWHNVSSTMFESSRSHIDRGKRCRLCRNLLFTSLLIQDYSAIPYVYFIEDFTISVCRFLCIRQCILF